MLAIRRLAVLALGVAFGASPLNAATTTRIPFEVVAQPQAGWVQMTQDRVIRNGDEWAAFWTSQFPNHPVPEVDFGTKIVVLTALGFTASDGASIHVTRVTATRHVHVTNDLLTVYIQETRPRATCIGTGQGSAPFEAIVVDNYLEVTFRRTSRYVGCT